MLHHERVGAEGAPGTVLVMPGIFGAGRNWRSVARGVVLERHEWAFLLLDLRLHGQSQEASPPHTIESAAADVVELWHQRGRGEVALLGHSFGGKVALVASRALNPRQVWIVDSTPSARPPAGQAVRMLEAVRSGSDRFESREAAIDRLGEAGFDRPTAAWMTTNLEPVGDGLRWRFDVEGMSELLDSFFDTDAWPALTALPDSTAHVIRATRSEVLSADDLARLDDLYPSVRTHRLAGGHWIHAEDPAGVIDLLVRELPPLAPPGSPAPGARAERGSG